MAWQQHFLIQNVALSEHEFHTYASSSHEGITFHLWWQFNVRPTGCISLLGMEGGAIAASQISASSLHYGILGLQRWGPELARLNNQGIVNAWTSASHDRNPWIEVKQPVHLTGQWNGCEKCESHFNGSLFLNKQINMQKKIRLTGIITQGASRMGTAEYIKAFKVASSLDGNVYTTFRVEGQWRDKVGRFFFLICSHAVDFTLLPIPELGPTSMCCRFSLQTQITTAQRPTCLTLPSSPSSSASSLWFAAGRARCVWSWSDVSSTVNTQGVRCVVVTFSHEHWNQLKKNWYERVIAHWFCIPSFFLFVCLVCALLQNLESHKGKTGCSPSGGGLKYYSLSPLMSQTVEITAWFLRCQSYQFGLNPYLLQLLHELLLSCNS